MTLREWLEIGERNGWSLVSVEESEPEPSVLGDGIPERRIEVRIGEQIFGNTQTWLAENGPIGHDVSEHMRKAAWRDLEAAIGLWLRGEDT